METEEHVLSGLPHDLCDCSGRADFTLDPDFEGGLWCIISGVSSDGIGTVTSVHQDWDCAVADRVYGQELWLRFDSPDIGDQVCRV